MPPQGRVGTALAHDARMASILVVDDCPPIAGILARYLRVEGHDVSIAHEGASARALLVRKQPDCIFLDLMMPVMTGVELLHELKRDPATVGIPIVLVSARVAAVLPHAAACVAPRAGARSAARGPLTDSI